MQGFFAGGFKKNVRVFSETISRVLEKGRDGEVVLANRECFCNVVLFRVSAKLSRYVYVFIDF